MESMTCEPPVAETDADSPRPWPREPEAADAGAPPAMLQEETPTEPGYGHGV